MGGLLSRGTGSVMGLPRVCVGDGGKRRPGVNSEVILIISSIVLKSMNLTPILTHKWSDEPARPNREQLRELC